MSGSWCGNGPDDRSHLCQPCIDGRFGVIGCTEGAAGDGRLQIVLYDVFGLHQSRQGLLGCTGGEREVGKVVVDPGDGLGQFSQCRNACSNRGVQVDLAVELREHIGNEGLTGRACQRHRTGLGTQCQCYGLNNLACRLDLAHARCGLLHGRCGRDDEVGHLGRLAVDGQRLCSRCVCVAAQCRRNRVETQEVVSRNITPQIEQARQSKRRSVGGLAALTYALDQRGERRDGGGGVRGTEHASEGQPRTVNVFTPQNVDGS